MNRLMPNMPLGVDPNGRNQPDINRNLTETIRQLWLRANEMRQENDRLTTALQNLLVSVNFVISTLQQTRRITDADSPYTMALADASIYADTDGGPITVLLRPGASGKKITLRNCGTSGNDVTITPNGSDLLFGVNANETLLDGEVLDMQYEPTEGWF